MHTSIHAVLASCLLGLASGQTAPTYMTLPPTPSLPGNPKGSLTEINGVQIWHAEFGTASPDKLPVLMLHGGFGNSDYFGSVIDILMANHYVIAMDTRGHGRSTMDATPFTYELYASDVTKLLDALSIKSAAWVGWSDMADGTFAALMDPALSPYVDRAFAFGGNHDVSAANATFPTTDIYSQFISGALASYAALQPDGNVTELAAAVTVLETTLPVWTEADFAKINLGAKVTVADGEFEEAVNRDEPAVLNGFIAGSKLKMLTNVSHFAPVQDPKQFAAAVEEFLA